MARQVFWAMARQGCGPCSARHSHRPCPGAHRPGRAAPMCIWHRGVCSRSHHLFRSPRALAQAPNPFPAFRPRVHDQRRHPANRRRLYRHVTGGTLARRHARGGSASMQPATRPPCLCFAALLHQNTIIDTACGARQTCLVAAIKAGEREGEREEPAAFCRASCRGESYWRARGNNRQ